MDDWIWFHIPVGYLYAMGNPRAPTGATKPSRCPASAAAASTIRAAR